MKTVSVKAVYQKPARTLLALGTALAASLCATPASAKVVALLVGVSYYPQGISSLPGVMFDVPAMKAVVIDKMGAAPQDVRILLNQDATQARIVEELKALVGRSAPGDTVVIYFSGHGTSSRDADNRDTFKIPMGTSGFVPVDVLSKERDASKALITGRQHLMPLALLPLDKGGRQVVLIADSCFSGNIVRAVNSGPISRYAPIGGGSSGGDTTPPTDFKDAKVEQAAFPYSHVVMISASADTEKAMDLNKSETMTGQPQGALTDTLLRAFAGKIPTDFNGDGKVSFAELQRAVREDLGKRGYAQSPQILPSLAQDKESFTFTGVPGLGSTPTPTTPSRISVTVPTGDTKLSGVLNQGNELTVSSRLPGEFQVVPGKTPNHYSLHNRAGDTILEEANIDVVFDRLRAGSWANRAIAAASSRVDLSADTQPTAKGGTFVIGRDRLRMALRANAAVHYLVVNVDSHGNLVTLWPTTPGEDTEMAGGKVQIIPSDTPIIASDPAGLDHVLVFAFPTPPPGMGQWYGLNAPFSSATANQFTQWLAGLKVPYAATSFDVRSVIGGGL